MAMRMSPSTYAALGEMLLGPCPGRYRVPPVEPGGPEGTACSLDGEVLEAFADDYDGVSPAVLGEFEEAVHDVVTGHRPVYDLPLLDDDPTIEIPSIAAIVGQAPEGGSTPPMPPAAPGVL